MLGSTTQRPPAGLQPQFSPAVTQVDKVLPYLLSLSWLASSLQQLLGSPTQLSQHSEETQRRFLPGEFLTESWSDSSCDHRSWGWLSTIFLSTTSMLRASYTGFPWSSVLKPEVLGCCLSSAWLLNVGLPEWTQPGIPSLSSASFYAYVVLHWFQGFYSFCANNSKMTISALTVPPKLQICIFKWWLTSWANVNKAKAELLLSLAKPASPPFCASQDMVSPSISSHGACFWFFPSSLSADINPLFSWFDPQNPL